MSPSVFDNRCFIWLLYSFLCIFCVQLSGWQWEPHDRPTFRDIHNALDNMFPNSDINEGCTVKFMAFLTGL